MKGDDDEEDDANVNATRYPCMPSLVALQQMRNRLHLAHLGKKLMKWTAMATGRELRRLAFEIEETYKNFAEDMRAAFMLLARGRYFYPNLNSIVLENVSNLANVTVATSTKTISGVKVLQLEVIENGISPYEHLGIEKGGQKILEAKIAWLDLLKRLIVMLQQRTSFNQLEMAHKSATKKKNVLEKIVIPRTKVSIKYMVTELEELAREDFYRLKKILEVKKRKLKGKKEDPCITCPICLKAKSKEEIENAKCIVCGALLKSDKSEETEKEKDTKDDEKLEEFKAHIKDIIEISKSIEDEGLLSESVEEFMHSAEILKEKLERKEEDVELEPIPSNVDVAKLCIKCKKRFDEEQAAKRDAKELEKEEDGKEKPESLPHLSIPEPTQKPLPYAPQLCELHANQQEPDLELGTFETEIQQIIKIIRIKNDDGSVTEEKKVVKIKREIRTPVKPQLTANSNVGRVLYQPSDTSSKSNPYPSKNTVGIMTVPSNHCLKNQNTKCSNAQLHMLPESSTVADAFLKHEYSSTTTLFSNSAPEIDPDFGFISAASNTPFINKICEYRSSEEEFKSTLSFTDPVLESDKTSHKNTINSYLTGSETRILKDINGKRQVVQISKSCHDVTGRKRRKVGHSVSLYCDIRRGGDPPFYFFIIT